ncbi:MAG: aspartate aminotransferase family protein [Spirochaetia bacterium]|jgi:acetylornithine/N-succinyldiaminopimelate aminotransferase|nr:aspartate aminotransferase family protein [Spirochaetia bacterium]
MTNLKEKASKVLMHTYNSLPFSLVSGNGCYVKDHNGNEYLDFIAGIAVNALGYNHPEFNKAVKKQLENIIHYSNLFLNKEQIELAEKLTANSRFDKAFFCNSGTESVEAALKLAKKIGKTKKNGAWKIIAMNQSFHGRSTGSLSLTGQKKYQESFLPLMPGVSFVEFNNFDDLKQKIDSDVCAVIIEPIQGEGGIYPAEKEYLEKVRSLCTEKNIVLIFDEVQSGIGRTGFLFAHEYFGVYPDIICLAKGLGGGLPIGAILSTEDINQFKPGDHAATFGGNPLVCSGANAVLTELLDNKLIEHTKKTGVYLKKKLIALQERNNSIKDIRGIGLMLGIEFNHEISGIISSCREHGLLLVGAGVKVIRFVPPLIVTEKEIDKALDILENVIKKDN